MSNYEESEIEASFDYCGNFMNVSKARAEYESLRSRAAEADALRAERDELKKALHICLQHHEDIRVERDELKAKANVSICAWCGQECEKESGAIAEHVIVCEKRPEHAMLAKFEELLHTVAAQAQTIEAAREVILDYRDIHDLIDQDDGCGCFACHGARAWLAANAQAQDETESEK